MKESLPYVLPYGFYNNILVTVVHRTQVLQSADQSDLVGQQDAWSVVTSLVSHEAKLVFNGNIPDISPLFYLDFTSVRM
jgi:hypothetical protein